MNTILATSKTAAGAIAAQIAQYGLENPVVVIVDDVSGKELSDIIKDAKKLHVLPDVEFDAPTPAKEDVEGEDAELFIYEDVEDVFKSVFPGTALPYLLNLLDYKGKAPRKPSKRNLELEGNAARHERNVSIHDAKQLESEYLKKYAETYFGRVNDSMAVSLFRALIDDHGGNTQNSIKNTDRHEGIQNFTLFKSVVLREGKAIFDYAQLQG